VVEKLEEEPIWEGGPYMGGRALYGREGPIAAVDEDDE